MSVNIGITPFFRHDSEELYLEEKVVLAVTEFGANAVVLPLIPDERGALAFLRCLDGLLISGSVHTPEPRIYGQESMHPMPYGISPYKNNEIPLIQSAVREHQMPVLGLCGGHQNINVACGGTMIQKLDETDGKLLKHNFYGTQTPKWYGVHDVHIATDSYAGRLLGPRISVNSYHEDAIGAIGAGLIKTGQTSDGVCEILESADMEKQYIFGTQFHPELMRGDIRRIIFSDFVAACEKYAKGK